MQLIRAKLRPPRPSPDVVTRPRLIQQLNAGLACKLTLVSAPAGFGKTTLLSEWAQQTAAPVAWITFDRDDDNLHSFLAYFIAAIDSIYPDSFPESRKLLNIAFLPSFTSVASILAGEISMLAGELILVLDDYHQLQQIAIHDLVDRLITYLPPTFHLVLGSRSSPPLSLVTLRARGQLSELRQIAMSFTSQETRDFFCLVGQHAPDDETLAALTKRTEGWPAGIRLLLLSAEGYDDLRSFASQITLGDTEVMSYLTDQVLSKQSPDLVHFLLCTAIVERFSLPLYAAIAPEKSEQEQNDALLAECLRENLFIVALGDGWYRYHPLFRELLLHHQERQIGRKGLAEQYRRASQCFEQLGLVDDAIRHALLAGEELLAVAVLDRQRVASMNQEQWPQLERWLALFPRSMVESYPVLAVTRAWIFNAKEMGGMQRAAIQRPVMTALPAGRQTPPSICNVQELVDQLTQREIEILNLIDKGMSNKQIAQQLLISDKTVENHTTHIYQKLDVRSRMQAARRAKDLHLLGER